MLALMAQNVLQKSRLRWCHAVTLEPSGDWGKCQECSNSTTRGVTMPAFTFEKISPPRRGPIAPIVKKQRGLVVQILERFVEARVKREEKRVRRTKPKV